MDWGCYAAWADIVACACRGRCYASATCPGPEAEAASAAPGAPGLCLPYDVLDLVKAHHAAVRALAAVADHLGGVHGGAGGGSLSLMCLLVAGQWEQPRPITCHQGPSRLRGAQVGGVPPPAPRELPRQPVVTPACPPTKPPPAAPPSPAACRTRPTAGRRGPAPHPARPRPGLGDQSTSRA